MIGFVLVGTIAFAFSTAVHAQPAWPSRPIRLVSPLTPGGPTDILARLLAAGFQDQHGQTAIVENISGGNGIIGMDNVRRSAADGHTMVVAPSGALTIAPTLIAKLPYSVERDFVPIGMLARSANVLVANPAAGIGNVKELVALAKAKPGTLSFATPGIGSGLHLIGELFRQQTGTDLLHVPYKGTGPALTDVLNGSVPLMLGSLQSLLPHVRAGKLRAIGVTDTERSPTAPDIPTLVEQGASGVVGSSWYGLLAPAGTSASVVTAIAQDVQVILARPANRERFDKQGLNPWLMSPQEFRDHIATERTAWAKIIRERNITAE